MKTLSEQMVNFDRENFARVARGMPEIQDVPAPKVEQTAEIFNSLFSALRAAFPASVHSFNDQAEFNELRRQWLMAFRENGITTMEQVNAGLRVARRQERPFLPSPGQFVAWCRAEDCVAVGLPDQAELMDVFYQYCRCRGRYPDAESYPWKSNACYWLVTSLYQQMRARSMSDGEVRKKAGEDLIAMALRIRKGEVIPAPKKQLPILGGKPLTQAQQLQKIREIQAKHGFKGRV